MIIDRVLQAAEGYGELGMFEDAMLELNSIPEPDRSEMKVSQMRMFLLLRFKHWLAALEISQQLCSHHPDQPVGFIHAAFCLHELGRTEEARDILISGPQSLLEEATYYYNLACYNAVLGETGQARAYLKTSFKMNRKFRELAENDPDLRTIWQEA